jgi:CRP-like cAMP-binding protein
MLRKNAKVALIGSAPLFSRCTKKELAAIASIADELDVPAGKELVTQGGSARDFCVIVEGAADVAIDGRRVNLLGEGDFFGEIALISGGPRTATVTATAPCRLLVLTDRDFGKLVREIPSVQSSVLRAVAERLHDSAI